MQGKHVLIIFQDGEKANRREGIVTRSDKFFIEINHKDLIPLSRIIRVEVKE